jgi:hypothetical protein
MRRGKAYRYICGALLFAQLGCSTGPRPIGVAPQAYFQSHSPKKVWVTLTTGDRMVIDHPRVYGDSLLGYTTTSAGLREEIWMPLSDLQEIRARQGSSGKTALALGAVGGVAFLLTMVFKGGTSGERPCTNEGEPCEGS